MPPGKRASRSRPGDPPEKRARPPDKLCDKKTAAGQVVQELALTLGKSAEDLPMIRVTGGSPPRISVIDVVSAITGHGQQNSARELQRIEQKYGGECPRLIHHKFPGDRAQTSWSSVCGVW